MNEEVFIIIPSYNEGETIVRLIEEISAVAGTVEEKITIVIVDDCSNDDTIIRLKGIKKENVKIRVISLLFNLGHQGAIAQGILFAHSLNASHAIIMDGDGEDDPNAIPRLLALKGNDIVNVTRGKRSEPVTFRIAYGLYRLLFHRITGKKMNFGNFCLISERVMAVLSVRTFIHFAAFLSKLGFKTVAIRSDRRPRLGGTTKMSVSNLIHHAFRSFAEYSEALLMVFLRLFVLLFIFFIVTIGYIIYLKMFTEYPILGWSSTFGIGLLTAALICVGFFVSGVMQLNLTQYRNNLPPAVLYKVIQ